MFWSLCGLEIFGSQNLNTLKDVGSAEVTFQALSQTRSS